MNIGIMLTIIDTDFQAQNYAPHVLTFSAYKSLNMVIKNMPFKIHGKTKEIVK